MMSFELPATKARVLDVVILSHKNRKPDEAPGVKIIASALVPNNTLSGFHGSILHALYTREASSHGETPAARQRTLDGVPEVADLPDLTWLGSHVKAFNLHDELTGYALSLDRGLGGRSIIVLDDCKLLKFRITPQKGGVAQIQFSAESANVDDPKWSRLARLKSTEVEIGLRAPEVHQADIDDKAPAPSNVTPLGAAVASRAPIDATEAFLAQHGTQPGTDKPAA